MPIIIPTGVHVHTCSDHVSLADVKLSMLCVSALCFQDGEAYVHYHRPAYRYFVQLTLHNSVLRVRVVPRITLLTGIMLVSKPWQEIQFTGDHIQTRS